MGRTYRYGKDSIHFQASEANELSLPCDYSKPTLNREAWCEELSAPTLRDNEKLRIKELRQGGFQCVSQECKLWVGINEEMGTKNRNHCPCCLSSRHMDEQTPGDRRSECNSRMEAIGLTRRIEGANKYERFSKFSPDERGELMLIHCCVGCNKLNINRLAADDNNYSIAKLLEQSSHTLEEYGLQLKKERIKPIPFTDFNKIIKELGLRLD